jgi:ABC-2 type transport system ATP-binding protein
MTYAELNAPADGEPMVAVVGLRKAYGQTVVLDCVDFEVAAGSVIALLGPNGAGKTTAVRILATLLRFDAGEVRVAGFDVAREPIAVRRVISLTGQHAAVDEQQTGRENLTMIGQLLHLGRRRADRRAGELLERFDLVAAGSRRVHTYSGGMRRRLDLAMSLVGSPLVILLDEPTAGLDPVSRATMWQVVRDLVAGGTTIVLTTQYLEEADQLADRIVLIADGRVVADGRADELKARVGGTRIDLRFGAPDDAAVAARMLNGVGALVGADGCTVGLPTDGSAAEVHVVLDTLAAADVEPLTIDQHRPTLDDVFLAATGARS